MPGPTCTFNLDGFTVKFDLAPMKGLTTRIRPWWVLRASVLGTRPVRISVLLAFYHQRNSSGIHFGCAAWKLFMSSHAIHLIRFYHLHCLIILFQLTFRHGFFIFSITSFFVFFLCPPYCTRFILSTGLLNNHTTGLLYNQKSIHITTKLYK